MSVNEYIYINCYDNYALSIVIKSLFYLSNTYIIVIARRHWIPPLNNLQEFNVYHILFQYGQIYALNTCLAQEFVFVT